MLWVLQYCSVDAGNSRTLFPGSLHAARQVVHFPLRSYSPVNLWPRSQARQHNTRREKKTFIAIASLSWNGSSPGASEAAPVLEGPAHMDDRGSRVQGDFTSYGGAGRCTPRNLIGA
jgi:hypothetical protein